MRGFEIIAIVIGVFFAMGIAAGMLLVIALPLLRGALRTRRNPEGTRTAVTGGSCRPMTIGGLLGGLAVNLPVFP